MRVLLVGHWLTTPMDVFVQAGHEVSAVPPTQERVELHGGQYDFLLAFPPCKYLCSSGLHWNKRRPERAALTEQSVEFVRWLMALPIERICIENPVGCLSSRIRRPDQIIQPYDFGHDASKRTCLWLKGLPFLEKTKHVPGRIVKNASGNDIERWANQFDSGQNNAVNADNRAEARAERYRGIMEAMRDQWLQAD